MRNPWHLPTLAPRQTCPEGGWDGGGIAATRPDKRSVHDDLESQLFFMRMGLDMGMGVYATVIALQPKDDDQPWSCAELVLPARF